MPRVLAADIGATNARFALVDGAANEPRIAFERTYPTASFPDFEPALQAFLDEAQRQKLSRAAIAIAAPIQEGVSRLTNRSGWTVDRHALSKLGVEATLINDFQALAHGVAHAAPGDWIVLQEGKPLPHGPIALVGAGNRPGRGLARLEWAALPRPSLGRRPRGLRAA